MLMLIALCPSAFATQHHREVLIRITTEKQGDSTKFIAENLQAADVTVTFEVESENLNSSVPLPTSRTLPARGKVELTTLSPGDPVQHWKWAYTYYATFGSLEAKHDDSVVYALPYAPGQSFRVSQAYHGEFSHFGPNEYAIDWKMPIGTPIHAARDGVVVGAKDDSNLGGPSSEYDADANYVLIRHSDGTLGHYVHLLKGGNKVKVGDSVKTGDCIGLSGNTGHSTGPHLHFAVFKARSGKMRQTLPVRYQTGNATAAVVLESGKSYKAPGIAAMASRQNQSRDAAAMGRP